MLLNLGTLSPPEDRHPLQFHLGLYSVLALVLVLMFVVRMAGLAEAPETAAVAAGQSQTRALAETLFAHYLAPFELASVLLLVAMVGAVVLAKRRL
jgi:NADH-quinone oxidoreductase subunit J